MNRSVEEMLWREEVANTPKHWVRAVTACNSRCLFCLDSDTPRNVYLPEEEVRAELDRGLDELGAEKVIISGGEASLHPKFHDFVRYAKGRGYDRVQTVTNGYRFADRDFFEESMEAGLGEITFSLHGHTPELHDHLTGTPGAYKRLLKGLVRALRDGRPIVNVDVVINKQNVAVIDKIVELCASLGVTEFDLLHVIPQAAAFDHRDELFYDVRDHLPVLQKVFRLNRHPRFVIWTNRFPVSFLEGLEDLIQDPHKMLDEVNGRRFQVRRYLDEGKPLDCRDPERCPHCFIEPFCTTTDRMVRTLREEDGDVWWIGRESFDLPEVPFGCRYLGVEVEAWTDLDARALPEGVEVYVRGASAEPLPPARRGIVVAHRADQLEAWLPSLPDGVELEVELNVDTAPWLLAHRDQLEERLDAVSLVQPSHEHMQGAHAEDVRAPRCFFEELALPLVVRGLPSCLAPGAVWHPDRRVVEATIFDRDTGRLAIRPLARFHVRQKYRGKSVRCADCRVSDRCEGAPINMIRDQGLGMLTPWTDQPEADTVEANLQRVFPDPPGRLETGKAPEGVAPSLPGYAAPTAAPEDPLAVIAREQLLRKAKKRARALGIDRE